MSKKYSEMLKLSILSDDHFDQYESQIPKQVIAAKQSVCKDIISHIKKVIKSKTHPPQQKLRGLKILDSCIKVANINFLILTQEKILTRLGILASYKKEVPVEIRAEGIFGKEFSNNPVFKESSIEFINTLLKFLKSWALDFGKMQDGSDSLFFSTYMKLRNSGVRFPSEAVNIEEKKAKDLVKPQYVLTIERLLGLVNQGGNENMISQYKKMIKSHKASIKAGLKKARNENLQDDIEMFMELIEKVDEVCYDGKNEAEDGSLSSPKGFYNSNQDFAPRSQSDFNYAHHGLVTRRTCENLEFDKESSVSANTRRDSAFSTPVIIDSSRNSVNEREFQVIEKFKIENFKLVAEIDKMKVVDLEKEEIIKGLKKKVESLELENKELKEEMERMRSKDLNRETLDTGDYNGKGAGGMSFEGMRDKQQGIVKNEASYEVLDLDFSYKLKSGKGEGKKEGLVEVKNDYDFTFGKNENAAVSSEICLKESKLIEQVPNKGNSNEDYFDLLEPSIKTSDKSLSESVKIRQVIKPSHEPPIPKPSNPPQPILLPLTPSIIPDPCPQKPIEIQTPDQYLPYRVGNCMDKGILFENDSIHIAFQLKTQNQDVMCIVYIGNKSSNPILEIITHLDNIDEPNFPILMQPTNTNEKLEKGNQTTRMIKAQYLNPSAQIPKLKIIFKSIDCFCLTVFLPITIARICRGIRENVEDLWSEWRKLALEEKIFEVNLMSFNNHLEICSFLTLGTGFAIFSKGEINELGVNEYLGVGRFDEVLVMFTANVSASGLDARVRVRSRNNPARDCLAQILVTQISKVPLI